MARQVARKFRIQLDLHRAGGLWLWPLFFLFGCSSVMLGLRQVHEPVTHALERLKPNRHAWTGTPASFASLTFQAASTSATPFPRSFGESTAATSATGSPSAWPSASSAFFSPRSPTPVSRFGSESAESAEQSERKAETGNEDAKCFGDSPTVKGTRKAKCERL